jgi:hypothetical protein
VGLADLNDKSILCFYDNIRRQVDAERGLPFKFMNGPEVRQRAAALLEELIKRRLEHTPIEWQPGVAEKITAMGMVDVNESSPECVVDWPVDKEG